MRKKIGRPAKRESEKKRKVHVSVDPEIYEYLMTLENVSEFMNKAAWVLLKAYRKARKAG